MIENLLIIALNLGMTHGDFLYNNEKNAKDNDELGGSSSSSTLDEKNQ